MQFIDFSWMPILIPFIIGVNKFKYFSNPLKLLFLFVGYGTVNEISVFFLRHIIDIKNTNPATNIYVLVSFLLMGLYFAFLFDGFIKKKNIFFIIICFELYSLINLMFLQNLYEYALIPRSIRTIIFVIFPIIYFYKIMIEANIKNLWNVPYIWINTGILIYYSGNLFHTILFNIILEYSREFSKLTVVYFNVLNALFYILIAIGFLKFKKIKH